MIHKKVSAVLCFMVKDGEVLLIEKKRGLGAGKVNGPGGKIDPGETGARAAIRECEEEVAMSPIDPDHRGHLDFYFTDGLHMAVDVFFAHSWTGTPQETEEALPFWCSLDTIPYERMWEDDQYWLPQALAGARFTGSFDFDGDVMKSKTIEFFPERD